MSVASAKKHAHSANESREAGDPSVYNLYNNIEKLSSITHIMVSRKATHNKRGVMSLLPDHQHHCRRVRDKYSRLDLANESFLFRQSFWLSNYFLTSNTIFVRKWFWPTLRFFLYSSRKTSWIGRIKIPIGINMGCINL